MAPSAPTAPPVPEPRPAPRPSPSILQPATPASYNFRFAGSKEFKDKFERLAEVLGVENPLQHMAEILERAVDIALDKKDLKRKLERRQERQAKRQGRAPEDSRPDEKIGGAEHGASRHIASAVLERVHARAGHQCEFVGPDGTRCRARTGLQIEHVRPFAMYPSHDERFLKLYCRHHNRLSAERFFGVEFIRSKIAAFRQRAAGGSPDGMWKGVESGYGTSSQ